MKIKALGKQPYLDTFHAMQQFTQTRTSNTEDEIWFCEHDAVFTQGRHGKPEHILDPHGIPIVQTDRGGQVTYHGPGQLMMYCLFDLKRLKMGAKQFVYQLEQSAIDTLNELNIQAKRQCGAPGVYVDNAKICALGLRIKHGYTYHGLALNVDMNLTPFSYINPCGYQDLQVTDINSQLPNIHLTEVEAILVQKVQLAKGWS